MTPIVCVHRSGPRRPPDSRGFTLIELMITLTVLAILLVLGMPGYTQWIQNTQIRNAAESVLTGMQRARAEAVSRNTTVVFTLGGGTYWNISVVSDGTVLDSKPQGEVSPNVTTTVTPNGATQITFGSLGTVVANAAGATITQIDVDSAALSAADSRNLRITVGAGGGVRMCDPTVTADTDPRKC